MQLHGSAETCLELMRFSLIRHRSKSSPLWSNSHELFYFTERKVRLLMSKIVAITSCPTGIAHTYMAAEGLEQAAKALGHRIKVETQGSVGARNELTPEEIRSAAVVVIAADTKV